MRQPERETAPGAATPEAAMSTDPIRNEDPNTVARPPEGPHPPGEGAPTDGPGEPRLTAGVPLYQLDDIPEPLTLEQLAEGAELGDEERAAIAALAPGESITLGGGAAAEYTVRCVARGAGILDLDDPPADPAARARAILDGIDEGGPGLARLSMVTYSVARAIADVGRVLEIDERYARGELSLQARVEALLRGTVETIASMPSHWRDAAAGALTEATHVLADDVGQRDRLLAAHAVLVEGLRDVQVALGLDLLRIEGRLVEAEQACGGRRA